VLDERRRLETGLFAEVDVLPRTLSLSAANTNNTPGPMSAMETTQLLTLPSRPAILLVDDDEATRNLVSTFAEQQGHSVHVCNRAEEALKRLREHFCPIVITDLNMPGMSGLELCRELRARKWPGYTYIVVLTGDHEYGTIAALEAGADDCLRKDAPPAELKARLRVAERIVTLEHRLRRTLEARARQAATDALTSLPNRRAFDRQFNAEFKRARRFGEALSVLLIDVDHFKQINDQHGHLVGDDVLRALALTLRTNLPRQFDTLARFGGEEFAIVLPQTNRDAALLVAERLRTAVESTAIQTSAGPRMITVSIGIGHFATRVSPDPLTTHDLLDEADRCLYESKRQGRNRVTACPPAEPRSLADASM
jgi:diguanylate cyclase (GGDEF)-like protein